MEYVYGTTQHRRAVSGAISYLKKCEGEHSGFYDHILMIHEKKQKTMLGLFLTGCGFLFLGMGILWYAVQAYYVNAILFTIVSFYMFIGLWIVSDPNGGPYMDWNKYFKWFCDNGNNQDIDYELYKKFRNDNFM